jgi:nitrite reductase/ring-hydroxylating ferredoxin subunit
MIARELAGKQIALYRFEGALYATDNICTHAYALLTDGWLDGDIVECPLHGGQFCITNGKAMSSPAEKALAVYELRVRDGTIEILLPDAPA